MRHAIFLFRGWSDDAGGFVYGAYIESKNLIIDDYGVAHNVRPYSAGIYTGFINRDGQKVFTGDVFQAFDGVVALVSCGNIHSMFPLELILYGFTTDSNGQKIGYTISKPISVEGYEFGSMIPIGNTVENKDWCPLE